MTAKRVRWNCPRNVHPAVLGPSRPALDSIVRYCLPCSFITGTLEKRIAPALERQRATARDTAAKKAAAKRARETAAKQRAKQAETERFTVQGVDLRDEMMCLLRLKAWNGHFGRPGRDGGFHRRPEFVVTKRSRPPLSRLGYAEPWRNFLSIAVYPGQTLADARETLVHELTHLVVGQHHTEGWHGATFHTTMTAAFKEAYKVTPIGVREGSYHGRYAAALARKEKGE